MSLLNCVNNKTKTPNKEKTPNKSFNKKSLRLELGVPINKAKSKKKVPKNSLYRKSHKYPNKEKSPNRKIGRF